MSKPYAHIKLTCLEQCSIHVDNILGVYVQKILIPYNCLHNYILSNIYKYQIKYKRRFNYYTYSNS